MIYLLESLDMIGCGWICLAFYGFPFINQLNLEVPQRRKSDEQNLAGERQDVKETHILL